MFANCPDCPGFLPPGAAVCPHCGADLPRGPAATSGLTAKLAKLGTISAMAVTLMACYGGGVDDVFFGCVADVDCGPGLRCDEIGQCVSNENCFNGFDDDQDGLIDRDDEDCAEVAFEGDCADGLDEDADGATDCADTDCSGSTQCLEICDDGLDNDQDGFIDCTDSDSCAACPVTEVDCGNLFDDDQDGLVDCDDADCDAVCTPPVCGDALVSGDEQCDDGNDLPDDGCTPRCAVEFTVLCELTPELLLGENTGNNEAGTNAVSASCVPAGGKEQGYIFTAVAAGTLYVSLQADHDMGVYIRDECGAESVEINCQNQVLGGQVESTSAVLAEGQSVWVVADNAGAGPGGPYAMTATFVQE